MSVSPIHIAISGLRAAQSQIAVTANNISNATTDGYSRKVLNQSSIIIDGQGAGVRTGIIERRIDEILVRDYRAQVSTTSNLEVKQRYMNDIQHLYGPPDGEYAISSSIGRLQNAFAQLANQPEDAYSLTSVYNNANQLATQFQQYSATFVRMRNDAQAEMTQSISRINQLTKQIAVLNSNIKTSYAIGKPIGELQDHRDVAVRELSKELDLSYFTDETNCLVVMTKSGQLLADTQAVELYFNAAPQGAQTYYPVSAASIMLGDPVTGVDITSERALGGALGALVSLRDETLPTYLAQLDELAYNMATRFAAQGLELFTRSDGSIPANNPVAYNGFAMEITVNPAIKNNYSLIRTGTSPITQLQTGSAFLLNKIVEFTFGTVEYEQITGAVDISDNLDTLHNILGINSQAKLTSTVRLDNIGTLDSLPHIDPPTMDNFNIQIGSNAPELITINAGDTLTDLVNSINAAIPGLASVSPSGHLVLTSNESIAISTGTIPMAGLRALGLEAGVTTPKLPSFELALGNNYLTEITIDSTDTVDDLLLKLNAIPGVDASLTPDGYLQIRPLQGGSITFVDGFANPLIAMQAEQSSVPYQSFSSQNLGPGANLNGRIQTASTLHDYATQMIGSQSQEARNIDSVYNAESSYMHTVQKTFLDRTGVNIDEEMASLITIQMAYTASARAISAIEAMMTELMNTFR